MRQDRECHFCGKPETVERVEAHHVFRRGSHPELKNEKGVLMLLCVTHHRLTESSHEFYKKIQDLWIYENQGLHEVYQEKAGKKL